MKRKPLVLPNRSTRRAWAVDVAMELLDSIHTKGPTSKTRLSLLIHLNGKVEIVRYHPKHIEEDDFGSLVGVYDRFATLTGITQDILAMEREAAYEAS